MSYIWNDYSWENQFRVSQDRVSPYMEVWDREGPLVFVNIFYRIYEFLMPRELFDCAEDVNRQMELYIRDERYKDMANLIMHYLARMDGLKGLRLSDIMERICEREMEAGRYGEKARAEFAGLDQREREIILRYLAKYNLDVQRETVFDGVLRALFHELRLYYENSTDTVYVYIGDEKSQYHSRVFELCRYLFMDVGIKAEVMWKGEHFGVLGVDDSMIIGKTAIR